MEYEVIIRRQARKVLQALSRSDRCRIVEKIVILGKGSNDGSLDIKRLQGQPYYRMRVGQWRVIFAKDDEIKIITIEKVKSRGGAYQ